MTATNNGCCWSTGTTTGAGRTILNAKDSWMRPFAVCVALTLVAAACGGADADADAEETAEGSNEALE